MAQRLRRAAPAVAALALVALAAPAQAAFPGRNGAIAFSHSGNSGGPGPQTSRSGLAMVPAGARDVRDLIVCERNEEGERTGGDCTVTSFGNPSYSADGRLIVFDAGTRIAVFNADGTGLRLLPAATADDGDPAFAR